MSLKFYPKEMWACRGSYTDRYSDEEVRVNRSHFEIWRFSQCHYPEGGQKFNLDFLGRWRSAETMPDIEERAAQ